MSYIAKKDSFFDEGTTILEVVEDFGNGLGVFIGLKDGKQEQAVCSFDEFIHFNFNYDKENIRGLNSSAIIYDLY